MTGLPGSRSRTPNCQLIFEVNETGLVAPLVQIVLAPNGTAIQGDRGRLGTDQPGYTELFRADFWSSSSRVYYDFVQYPNDGNMDWRILAYEFTFGGTTYVTGSPVAVASFTGQAAPRQKAGYFTLPALGLIGSPFDDVQSRRWTMRVEAKMNSGTRVDVALATHPYLYP